MNNIFDHNDLQQLFAKSPSKPTIQPEIVSVKAKAKSKKTWKTYLKFFLLFIVIFFSSYLAVNYSAIKKQLSFFWDVKIRRTSYSATIVPPTPTIDKTAPAKLVIPKIGIEAPILWDVEDSNLYEKLLEGVIHYKGTAYPGEKGNVFIAGHSSYYSWSSSPYKDIFSLLENMAIGDEIFIQYHGAVFKYKVLETKVVSPSELSVMGPSEKKQLTLMTCVPIGTNLKRLIVIGEQISS